MRSVIRAFAAVICFGLAGCSQVSDLIEALSSADCDSFILSEVDSALSEACRDLEGYLDVDSDSLASLSQILPVDGLADAGATFIQLTDAAGAPLTDISAEDVVVSVSTDGGEAFTEVTGESIQTLSEVETTQTSILAVIDYSGSISDGDLEDVVSGMTVFLENLEVGYAGAIMKFSTDVDLIQDFTETESSLLTAIEDDSYTREYTSLYDAIYDGVTSLSARTTPLRLMLLFTDGVDNDSERSLDEAVTYAQDNNIPICVVGVTFADTDTLQSIAEDTGCFYIYKQFFTSLDDAFGEFADQINNFQMVTLPDSFSTASGIIKVTVDAGESTAREFMSPF